MEFSCENMLENKKVISFVFLGAGCVFTYFSLNHPVFAAFPCQTKNYRTAEFGEIIKRKDV
jgi:hypothetical protein